MASFLNLRRAPILGLIILVLAAISCEKDSDEPEAIKPLQIFEVSPIKGGETDLITIKGEGFNPDKYKQRVLFGGMLVTIEGATKTELLVRIQDFMERCGDLEVKVETDSTQAVAPLKFNLSCPTIESFTPTIGESGTVISIVGTNYNPMQSLVKVTFGDNDAPIILQTTGATRTLINALIPSTTLSGKFPITVSIGNGNKTVTSSSSFRLKGPLVTGFTPSIVNGCTIVTINGEDFSPIKESNQVLFGSKIATVLEATANQLKVIPPFDPKEILNVPVPISVTVSNRTNFSVNRITVQPSWEEKVSLGQIGRFQGIGFSIDNQGYIGLGGTITNIADMLNDFWKYDEAGNTWIQKADFPGEKRLNAIGFSIGGKGYVGLGGDFSNNLFNDLWQYDPVIDTWERMPDMPAEKRTNAFAFVVDGKGYIGGGFGFGSTTDMWRFDPENKSWTRVADYPGIGTTGMVNFAIGNKGYVGMGFIANDFWEYNTTTNQWKQLKNFPGDWIHNSVSFSSNGFGIVATGAGPNGNRSNATFKYDPSIDTWIQLPGFSGKERTDAVGFTLLSGFMVGTGSTSFNYDLVSDFYRYACD